MSWSIGYRGADKADVKRNLALQAESPLAAYKGTPEEGDIRAALERLYALIDALQIGVGGTDGLTATALGSHTRASDGTLIGGAFSVSVTAAKL